jgi:hypothetical protein
MTGSIRNGQGKDAAPRRIAEQYSQNIVTYTGKDQFVYITSSITALMTKTISIYGRSFCRLRVQAAGCRILSDSRLLDSSLPDSSLPDSSLPDSSLPDSSLLESSLPERQPA